MAEKFTDFENLPLTLASALWLAEELHLELALHCGGGRRDRRTHRESAHQLRVDREALQLHFGIPEVNGKPVPPLADQGEHHG